MDKYEIVKRIENFAPLELAESWDCSGWLVETDKIDAKKIMLALTVTDDVIRQAKTQNCDMIISHHPLFFVPLTYKGINIYCAHTNMDKVQGGTTDKLIEVLGLPEGHHCGDFLRIVEYETTVEKFISRLSVLSPNLRFVNNKNISKIKKIAFCAGSGSEFINEAFEYGCDALVTGDLKFHTALESPIILFDIGHFESEINVLNVFKSLISSDIEVVKAVENSPFRQIKS